MDNDKKTSDVNELMTRLYEAAIHKLSVGNELKRQVIILMNEMNDDPERLLYGVPDKLPMWIQNVVSVCFSMKAGRNPALKWCFSPGGYEDDESLKHLARCIYHEPSMTKWVETVIDINTGIVDNLTQIDWQHVTSNWDDEVTEAIVMCLDGHELQMATIDCILDVWCRESAKVINVDTFNPKFEDFCLSLKRYLNNLSLYDIEAIREQENEGIEDHETEDHETAICNSTSIPSCLDSQLANQVLTRAVERGICEIADNGKYIWKGGSDVLLAYMIGRIVCGDYTNNDNKWVQRVIFPDKEMCEYWQIKDLGQKRNNKDTPPRGHERIDALFYQLEPLS